MSNGWVKIHRSLLDWEWWDSPDTVMLWLTILLSVNHEPKKWHGMVIQPGEMVTSLEALAKKSRLSVRRVRTSLNRLKSTQEVTYKTTSRFTLIKVVKWGDFQLRDEPTDTKSDTKSDKQSTNNRQTIDKQSTTNKKDKNDKNVKNIYNRPVWKEPVPDYIRRQFDNEEEDWISNL